MRENDKILLILKLLALCYPVLLDWGFSLEVPIVIILHGVNFAEFTRFISIFEPCIVTSLDERGRLKKCMQRIFSEPILIHNDDSFKVHTLIRELDTMLKTGYVDQKKAIGLPLIVSEDMISKDVISNVFYIDYYMTGENNISYTVIKPDVFNLSLIKEKITERTQSLQGNLKVLVAATCFYYPSCQKDEFEDLVSMAEMLADSSNEMTDLEGISNLFVEGLYEWRKQKKANVLFQLPNVPYSIEQDMKTYIFYDGKYIYMHNALFSEIVAKFKNLLGINALKKALSDDGLLVCGAGNTYTAKMNIWSEHGIAKRYDMLRFDMKRLDKTGEADFLTVFEGGLFDEN